ncbi:MAG: cupin domain-containing protein [Armatimonadota bacterium]|nr:MAG: cupin domain-containing protein [Armatimonadota bacterium]
MQRVNEFECEFRFGDSGPKYFIRGPKHEWGVIVFHPGQTLGAHRHREVEETFYFESGAPIMVVDGAQHRVTPGDVFRLDPGEAHDIINDSDQDTRIIFIKCPYLPEDKEAVD